MTADKQHAHALLGRLPADQINAAARSKEWFKHNEGIPFEQVVADLGLTMDQIRSASKGPSA